MVILNHTMPNCINLPTRQLLGQICSSFMYFDKKISTQSNFFGYPKMKSPQRHTCESWWKKINSAAADLRKSQATCQALTFSQAAMAKVKVMLFLKKNDPRFSVVCRGGGKLAEFSFVCLFPWRHHYVRVGWRKKWQSLVLCVFSFSPRMSRFHHQTNGEKPLEK